MALILTRISFLWFPYPSACSSQGTRVTFSMDRTLGGCGLPACQGCAVSAVLLGNIPSLLGKEKKVKVVAPQLCPTLRDSTNCSPLGSSVHGILQARILEWVAIFFSRGSIFPYQGLNLGLWHCRQTL